MSVILQQNNSIEFYLKSEGSPVRKIKEPIGWRDDGFEFVRNNDYHGIMTELTSELSFFKDDKDYIEEDFEFFGINSNLELRKYELREVGGDIKWVLDYIGIIDYSTRKINDSVLKLRFNSNRLEELLKTREDDEFDLDRDLSIEDVALTPFKTRLANFEGSELIERNSLIVDTDEELLFGEAVDDSDPNSFPGYTQGFGDYQAFYYRGDEAFSPVMKLITDSSSRVSSPDTTLYNSDFASRMFFVDKVQQDNIQSTLKIAYKFNAETEYRRKEGRVNTVYFGFYVYRKKEDPDPGYDLVREIPVAQSVVNDSYNTLQGEGEITIEGIAWNEGIIFGFYTDDNINNTFKANVYECELSIRFNSVFPPTTDHKFLTVHDAFNRLTEIITGKNDRFVSRLFGLKSDNYFVDGKYSGVSLVHGYSIRKWPESSDIYNPMKISFKDLYESINAVFNIGLGIEIIDGKQKIVVENSEFFYQNKVGLVLTGNVSNISRETIKEDYISSIEIGYDKGGDYGDALGIDEPNIRTKRITPIVKNKKEYRKVSKIRADDVGFEQTRRQQFSLFPDNELSEDEHIWFLDLKKTSTANVNWIQRVWQDRLRFAPENLSYAETFRSFLFTPLRMLFRHGKIIRIGLNQSINMEKTVSHISSDGNSSLTMQFIEDNKKYTEDQAIKVKELDRPLLEPETVKFSYQITNEFLDWLKGKTEITLNGEKFYLPNYYFKIEFKNEKGISERGYINSVKPRSNEIELIKSNEKIIVNG